MIKKILVPIDFSIASLNALEYASFIAKRNKGNLRIIHVITNTDKFPGFHPPSIVISKISSERELFIKGIKSVEERILKISRKSYLKDIDYRFDIKISGIAHMEIIRTIDEIKPELVVMGTYGETGFMENLMGSVTARVSFSSSIPILMVNKKIKKPKNKIIVFAGDFSDDCDKALPYVREFAESIGAKIHLLKVNTPLQDREKNSRLLLEFSKRHNLKCKKVVYDKTFVIDGIIEYSKSLGSPIIALVSHGRKGIRRWFDKNTFEIIRDFSRFSILTLNIKSFN